MRFASHLARCVDAFGSGGRRTVQLGGCVLAAWLALSAVAHAVTVTDRHRGIRDNPAKTPARPRTRPTPRTRRPQPGRWRTGGDGGDARECLTATGSRSLPRARTSTATATGGAGGVGGDGGAATATATANATGPTALTSAGTAMARATGGAGGSPPPRLATAAMAGRHGGRDRVVQRRWHSQRHREHHWRKRRHGMAWATTAGQALRSGPPT